MTKGRLSKTKGRSAWQRVVEHDVELRHGIEAVDYGYGCRCGASRKERPEEATLLLFATRGIP